MKSTLQRESKPLSHPVRGERKKAMYASFTNLGFREAKRLASFIQAYCNNPFKFTRTGTLNIAFNYDLTYDEPMVHDLDKDIEYYPCADDVYGYDINDNFIKLERKK